MNQQIEASLNFQRMTKEQALGMASEGLGLAEISKASGYPEEFLKHWLNLSADGKPKPEIKARKSRTHSRNLTIAEKYLIQSVSMSEVGKRHKISRQRVYQILTKFGIERQVSGAAQERLLKTKEAETQKLLRLTIPEDQLRELRKLGLTRRRSAINALYARKGYEGSLSLSDMYALFSPLYQPLLKAGKSADEIIQYLSKFGICRKNQKLPLSIDNAHLVKTKNAEDTDTEQSNKAAYGLIPIVDLLEILFPGETEWTKKRKFKILRSKETPLFPKPKMSIWRRNFWEVKEINEFIEKHGGEPPLSLGAESAKGNVDG